MRIAFVNPSVGTTAGGSESVIRSLAHHLGKRHRVTVITGRYPNRRAVLKGKDFSVKTAPYLPRFTPANALLVRSSPRLDPYKVESLTFHISCAISPSVRKAISESDVVSTHYRLDSKLFSGMAERLGTKSVFHILGTVYNDEFFRADRSDMYVGTTRCDVNELVKKVKVEIPYVVSPGVPDHLFESPPPPFDKRKGLLFVGRLQPSKGLSTLLDTMKELPGERLSVVGTGESAAWLSGEVKKAGLKDRIRLLGERSQNDVFRLMTSSKILLFPSVRETFGMVPLEANACGLPVIAFDLPQVRESTGGNAVFLDTGDGEAWAAEVGELLDNENAWRSMSEEGREWASRNRWSDKARQYEACLSEVVNR